MFPKTEKKVVGGLECKAKSFKFIGGFAKLIGIKRIGGKLVISARCKIIRERGSHVYLSNFYFLKVKHSGQLIEWIGNPGYEETVNKRRTVHRHFAFGWGIKLNLDGELKGGGAIVDLPIVGVVSEARVNIGKEYQVFITQNGSVPDVFTTPYASTVWRQADLETSVLGVLERMRGLKPTILLKQDVPEVRPSQNIPNVSLKQELFGLTPN